MLLLAGGSLAVRAEPKVILDDEIRALLVTKLPPEEGHEQGLELLKAGQWDDGLREIERGCRELEQPSACDALARSAATGYVDGGLHAAERWRAAGRRLERSQCADGDWFACGLLGDATLWGHGVRRDERRARQLIVQSCEGTGSWCAEAASLVSAGVGGKADERRAVELAEHGCTEIDGASCAWAAYGRFIGTPAIRDRAAALKQMGTACELGDRRACRHLGLVYELGIGVPPSLSEAQGWRDVAVKSAVRDCGGGHWRPCSERLPELRGLWLPLGNALLGLGAECVRGEVDGCLAVAKAVRVLRAGRVGDVAAAWIERRAAGLMAGHCTPFTPLSCRRLARLRSGHSGEGSGDAEARELLTVGCLGDDLSACLDLPSSEHRARRLPGWVVRLACAGHDPRGCALLAEPGSPDAVDALIRRCFLGDADACAQAARAEAGDMELTADHLHALDRYWRELSSSGWAAFDE